MEDGMTYWSTFIFLLIEAQQRVSGQVWSAADLANCLCSPPSTSTKAVCHAPPQHPLPLVPIVSG